METRSTSLSLVASTFATVVAAFFAFLVAGSFLPVVIEVFAGSIESKSGTDEDSMSDAIVALFQLLLLMIIGGAVIGSLAFLGFLAAGLRLLKAKRLWSTWLFSSVLMGVTAVATIWVGLLNDYLLIQVLACAAVGRLAAVRLLPAKAVETQR